MRSNGRLRSELSPQTPARLTPAFRKTDADGARASGSPYATRGHARQACAGISEDNARSHFPANEAAQAQELHATRAIGTAGLVPAFRKTNAALRDGSCTTAAKR